jgi:hypothetical protein
MANSVLKKNSPPRRWLHHSRSRFDSEERGGKLVGSRAQRVVALQGGFDLRAIAAPDRPPAVSRQSCPRQSPVVLSPPLTVASAVRRWPVEHFTKCRAPRPAATALLAAVALAAGGCAAGAWLESPSEVDLPLDRPVSGYPTAIRASLNDDAPPASAASPDTAAGLPAPSPPAAARPPALFPETAPAEQPGQRIQPPIQAAHQRFDHTQPLTPLAVVPPQYVRSAATPAATAAPAQPAQPPAAAEFAPLTVTVPAAVVNAIQPAGANLPGFAASAPVLPLGTLQPQAAPANAPVASISASASAASTGDTSAGSFQQIDLPAERQARIDRAQAELIDALETDIRSRRSQVSSDDALPRLEQQLRIAYLASNRLDEGVASVDSLEPAQREAFKHLMFGLGIWMSPDESRRAALRSAKVLHSLREAATELAAASKLEVRTVVFCERVDNFGWYSEFPRKEFQPKQQVILYAEVENFSADHKGPAGYETELQGSYEIFDSGGQLVTSRQLPADKEICRNYRRDYFLAYKIYLPDELSPGRYRLELTIEDLKARGKYQGRKLGEGIIEFTIR